MSAEDQAIFDYWKEQRHKNGRTVFDKPRQVAVKKMRQLGYTNEEMKAAIRGIAMSPHHMGRNDRGVVYDELSLIFRDAAHMEKFRLLDPGVKGMEVQEPTREELEVDDSYCQKCFCRGVIFGDSPAEDRRCSCRFGQVPELDFLADVPAR